MNQQEIINTITLVRTSFFSIAELHQLYQRLGSATSIIEHKNNLPDVIPEISPRFISVLKNLDEPLRRAEIELEYDLKYGITPLCLNDTAYPQRFKDCDDAPLVLFYKGNADLNQRRILSIVGTRHATPYGEDCIRRFIRDLQELCPQVLIVSGLAYGIDIMAHRYALTNGYETVAVLAHGLDDLYPARHRETAIQMVNKGGLLSEFLTQTNIDKMNFVKRNRIIAGIADACILVESAAKGGGLITASIAQSYNKDVFAFPGRNTDVYSEGCNQLIRKNGAGLITSASDFVHDMRWEDDNKLKEAQQKGIERQLFPDLSEEEKKIIGILCDNNDLQINILAVKSNIEIGRLTALLFSLEMKGVVKTFAGGIYHLIQ